jgi:hypothetical protein
MQYWGRTHNGQTSETGSIARCVLSQYSRCLWFVHYVTCPNNACVSGLSFPCPVSVMPVYGLSILCVLSHCCLCLVCQITLSCLNTSYVSVFLVYPFRVLSQYCRCLWFIHQVSLVYPSSVFSQYCMCLWFVHCVFTCNFETRHIMDKPETHAVLSQDRKWTNQRHRQY